MKKLVLLATIFIFSNITSANGSNAMQQDQINDIEKSNPIDEYFFTENKLAIINKLLKIDTQEKLR